MQSILDSKWLVFMKVAELGSLTKAATVFDVPQSMISRHVGALERQCGTRLFRRTGRGVVLTEFGEQLYPRLQALVQEADQLTDDIRSSGGEPAGEVRVGILPSAVPMLASKLFSTVKEKFPRVRLHLSDGPSTQLEEWLRDGRLDMALLLREGPVSDRGESVLAQISLRLIGPRNDPLVQQDTVDLSALKGLPLVAPSHPHPLRARLDSLGEARGISLNIAAEADSIRLQHELVAAGGGYAITSGLFEMDSDPRLASAKIVKPELLRSVVLSTSPRRPHTMATREVMRLIVQVVPELLRAKPEAQPVAADQPGS
jgi:LysR family transcriptional regulator, nitrogen assimilation regulatory protein